MPYPSAGRFVRSWIQRKLVHGEGDVLGEPVHLATVWNHVIDRIYQYDPATGQLLNDRIVIIIGKGNVKTETVGQLGLAEIDGPLAPISPNVPISAASWDNANRLFGAARLSILGDGGAKKGPLAERFVEGEHILEDRILLPEREGKLYRTAAVAGTNDGGLPTCYAGDELHEWITARARRMWTVQGKSLRKRRVPRPLHPMIAEALGIEPNWSPGVGKPLQPALFGGLQIAISTPGADQDSLLGDLYKHGVHIAKGEVGRCNDAPCPATDPGFLFMCWEADVRWDLEDPEQRTQAILEANPTCGEVQSIESIHKSFLDPTVPRSEFVRYNLSRWPEADSVWMPPDVWDASRGEVKLRPGTAVYAAVAVAHDHRQAAVAAAQRQDDRVLVRVTSFEAKGDEYVDVGKIEEHVRSLRASYPAPILYAHRPDPRVPEKLIAFPGPEVAYAGAFFEGSAQRLRQERLAMLDVPSSAERLAPAAEILLKLAIEPATGGGRRLVHEDDADLTRQILNVVARQAPRGWFVAAREGHQIPAAQAAMVAVHRAMTAPKAPPARKRVYGGFS